MQSCVLLKFGEIVLKGRNRVLFYAQLRRNVQRLLRERPKVRGLAVPGMVVGSPGMEQGPPQPYATLAFDDRGSRIFMRH